MQVGPFTLSDLVAEYFDVILHPTIMREMQTVLGRTYSRWKELGLVSDEMSEIRRNHASWTATRCSNASLEVDMALLDGENLHTLDEGEIDCIALAKHTSDERVSYVVFLTDDYEAGESANRFFDKYQCGIVVRSADLVSFFGIRLKLPKPEIHQGLRNIISFYTGMYESLLKEVKSLLPSSDGSYVYTLVYRGDFGRSKEAIARMTLRAVVRARLTTLIDELATLAGQKSVMGLSLLRLRALDGIRL